MSESNVNAQTEGLIETLNDVEVQDTSGADEVLETQKKPEDDKQEESKIDSKLASKFAALSKKEKAIRQREKDLERRLKQLEAKNAPEQAEAPKAEEVESFEMALKRNPLKALADKGLDFETLAKLALNDGKLTPEMQMQLMREEIESSYKKEIAEIKKELQEKKDIEAQQSVKQQVEGAKKTVFDFIDAAGDEFELIRTNESHQAVWDLIEQHFEETEELLDIKQAAEHIENQLLKNAEKHLNLNKIKKLMESKSPKKSEEIKKPASQTLTNTLSQSGQGAADRTNLMSDEESKALAAKLLKWTE